MANDLYSKMKPNYEVLVEKKDGEVIPWDSMKIINAVSKSARRVLVEFTVEQNTLLLKSIFEKVESDCYIEKKFVKVSELHNIVEKSLDEIVPEVAKSYRSYRDYKENFGQIMDRVAQRAQTIMYLGDLENSNADSKLVSTKRSLIFNELNKELYKMFCLNAEENRAFYEGFIYINDMSARRDTMNCSLFDVGKVIRGGFEMSNIWYNEPKSLDVFGDVLGDVVINSASQQYGGYSICEIDKLMEPYAMLTYERSKKRFLAAGLSDENAEKEAMDDVEKEMRGCFQGWEYKFNTVASSRGDYPFITMTFGLATSKFGRMASQICLETRMNGQGKKGAKKPVLFPKIVFLYDKNLHGEGKELEDIYKLSLQCSMKSMYPDYLSLTGDGYVSSMYQKYGKVVSPMGCRAFLSPWYERGGMEPADEKDEPVFVGRFNVGVCSLHLPMILAKARKENVDFFEVLNYYLNIIRRIHIKTYDYLGEMRASTNPLAYCEGGFYGGHLQPNEKIRPLLKSATASFGVTALNEFQMLYNGKSLSQDGGFALETMNYINEKIEDFKHADGHLYAVYGTPAENLCGLQVVQFRKMYGIVPGVSDKEYMSNSFHCHVTETISPTEKQDLEKRFWDYFNGGKIQYVKYPVDYNLNAIDTLIKRAMDMGLYEGANLSLSFCEECGYQELALDTCPRCGSKNITKIERMNGYLSYSRIHGETRLNNAKMTEIAERISM